MAYCTKCGNSIEVGAKFCNSCGAPVSAPSVQSDPVPFAQSNTAPSVQEYTPYVEQPVVVATAPAPRKVSVKARVLGYVSLGLGIGAIFFAIIGLLVTIGGMGVAGLGLGMAISYGLLFALPLAIVGKILANQSMEAGNDSKACSVGSVLSIVTIALTGLMLLLGLIALVG